MEANPEHIIRFENVFKSFGLVRVLNGINLSVSKGRSAVVMGSSGTGKSVLIKHIVRLLTPDSGEVWVNGQLLSELEKDDLMRETLGPHIFDHFVAAKREEWHAYMSHVSPWEVNRYLGG